MRQPTVVLSFFGEVGPFLFVPDIHKYLAMISCKAVALNIQWDAPTLVIDDVGKVEPTCS